MTLTPAATPTQGYDPNDLPEHIRKKIYVNPVTTCWEWTGARKKGGYGQTRHGKRVVSAHRYVYEAMVGPLQVNVQHLDHLCRVTYCVNPAHLEPVTPIENARRGLSAIVAPLPDDLYRSVLQSIERAYKRGVYDGVRQGLTRSAIPVQRGQS